MSDMFSVLGILNIVAHLTLAVLLVVLCFRTRSKGLILISAILLTGGIFSWLIDQGIDLYVDRWMTSQMNREGTQDTTLGEIMLTVAMIESLLYRCLCLLGGFLIYREWRLGKFNQPQPEHIKESTS